MFHLCASEAFYLAQPTLKKSLLKTLHCAYAEGNCPGVISDETEHEVLQLATLHAQEVHGVKVTPELAEQIKTLIKEVPAETA